VFLDKFNINSGVLRVARGGSGVKAPPLAVRPKLAGWGGSFLTAYRNNAGSLRLGAGFISVCLETCWLGQNCGFYVPECSCRQPEIALKMLLCRNPPHRKSQILLYRFKSEKISILDLYSKIWNGM